MTIQEYITLAETIGKDVAAVLGAIGALAAALAHAPGIPANWAAFLARFASYAATRTFDVTKKAPPKPDVDVPIHITIPPEARVPNDVPPAALRSLLLACFTVFACTTTPTPAPTPTATTTVPVPPPSVDAGTSKSDCAGAYARMFALGCPPAEDAHFGWRDIDCLRLSSTKVACIVNATNCAQSRACQE